MHLHSDGKLGAKPQAMTTVPLFRLAFRPFFWFASLFSVLAIALWAGFLSGTLNFSPLGGGHFWHIHEMLFGFTSAIVVGFLLTAVQTWTGKPSIKGYSLMGLFGLWALARVLLIFTPPELETVSIGIDLIFLPLAAFFLARPIILVKQWRNIMFVPILLIMAVLNAVMYLSLYGVIAISYSAISHMMVLMVSLVMCIIGGRVFPMFTANGTRTEKVAAIPLLETLSIMSIVLVIFSHAFVLSSEVKGFLHIFAATINFIRALRWRIWVTFTTPLVWPLHLSYWFMCFGLLGVGLVELGLNTSISLAYHSITVGGIGLMVLAMISRVSLGHTGRMIQVGRVMSFAFMIFVIGVVWRVMFPLFWQHYQMNLIFSAIIWIISYGLFVIKYAKVLFSARIDGRDG
ncbi:NnrS family protein [Pseudoalteromonas sp. SSM20]|uniref:NnrS family protein n=1 Tax=Pseudoalteromonas sp. SSM20 TaxID=3139394 RepID=UPI003BAA7417